MKLKLNYVYDYLLSYMKGSYIVVDSWMANNCKKPQMLYKLINIKDYPITSYGLSPIKHVGLQYTIYEEFILEEEWKVNIIETLKWKNGKNNNKNR